MNIEPFLLEFAKGLPTAIVALIVGVVAYRQYLVARAKLKLDLFDKRFDIYIKLFAFVQRLGHGDITDTDMFEDETLAIEAGFLFGKHIEKYVVDLRGRIKIIRYAYEIDSLNESKIAKSQANALLHENLNWFEEQYKTGIRETFAPYLNFEEWK